MAYTYIYIYIWLCLKKTAVIHQYPHFQEILIQFPHHFPHRKNGQRRQVQRGGTTRPPCNRSGGFGDHPPAASRWPSPGDGSAVPCGPGMRMYIYLLAVCKNVCMYICMYVFIYLFIYFLYIHISTCIYILSYLIYLQLYPVDQFWPSLRDSQQLHRFIASHVTGRRWFPHVQSFPQSLWPVFLLR